MERPTDHAERRKLRKFVAENAFDFFDFGCRAGANMAWAQCKLGGRRGPGIDRSEEKLIAARSAEFDVSNIDIFDLPAAKMARFTVMRQFLKHLPDLPLAARVFLRAFQVSTEFVLVVQPYFDADGFLTQQGLKLYWSHWGSHPNRMTSLDFYRCLEPPRQRGFARHFSIHGRRPIPSSDSDWVHPLTSPPNQHGYDASLHPEKPRIKFSFPVFEEIVVAIGIDHRPNPSLIRSIKASPAFVEL